MNWKIKCFKKRVTLIDHDSLIYGVGVVCQYVYGVGVVCWGLAEVLFHASSRKTRVFATPAFACPR
jgi:hypothetical protein